MKKIVQGKIIKNNMIKTVIVSIENIKKHNKYGKYIKKTIKLPVHNENNNIKINDNVYIKQCAPISKTKFWKII